MAEETLADRLRRTAEDGRSPILGHLHTGDQLMLEAADEIQKLHRAISIYGAHISPCPGRPCECGFQSVWSDAGLPITLLSVMDIGLENIELRREVAELREYKAMYEGLCK